MPAVSIRLEKAVRISLGQIRSENQVPTETCTAGTASPKRAGLFFRLTSRAVANEFRWSVSSGETALTSQRSAINADIGSTSSTPSPISAEWADRTRSDYSCARGVQFAP